MLFWKAGDPRLDLMAGASTSSHSLLASESEIPTAISFYFHSFHPFSSRGAEVKRGAMALRSYLSEQVGYNPASTSKIVII